MNHVSLDGVDEAVREFVLAVAVDPAGSVLELNGRPVARVVPAPLSTTNGEEPWTEAKNQRRCPDLRRLQPPGGNARPEGIEHSALVLRERGTLPERY